VPMIQLKTEFLLVTWKVYLDLSQQFLMDTVDF